jgi:hypothetical protein
MRTVTSEHQSSLVGDLAAKVALNAIKPREYNPSEATNTFKPVGTFYDCIEQNDLIQAVTDWETEFFPDTTTATITTRAKFRQLTAGGELTLSSFNGSNTYGARFARLIVYAYQPQDIVCHIGFVGSSAAIQWKVNGVVTTISGSSDSEITISLVPGYNFISFAMNEQTDGFQFRGLLFDGRTVQYVDPYSALNPTREGYISNGGSGGSSSNASGGLVPPEGS